MNHPRDLPQRWFEFWEERASLIQEGCKLPTDIEGTREANRRAFVEAKRLMIAEEDRAMRGAK